MQILNVKAQNFKGIKLVEVEPLKTTTIVGGMNKQGKSSLLDAVAATLGGTKLCPKRPIRDGEDKASCEIKLDGDPDRILQPCTVTRTWLRKKDGRVISELEITTDDGFHAPTPQTILNDVVGPLGFDPERFLRMKPKEQAEVLRNLVGLDFTALDAERQKAYDGRTAVNRDGKTLAARFDAMPYHADAPEEEVSVSVLMTELTRRQAVNRHNEEVRSELVAMRRVAEDCAKEITTAESDVADFEKRLQQAKDRVESLKNKNAYALTDVTVKSAEVDDLKDADEADVQQQIADSESVNRKVRENAERVKLETELEIVQSRAQLLSGNIKGIDQMKQEKREAAKWPVKGLGYDEDGVTLLDRPFEQASATEQREAAFGIVAALNPTLKFAMIKDGSLLDDESLADFARIAAEKGFQLFIERVGLGKECTIIISDGKADSGKLENDE